VSSEGVCLYVELLAIHLEVALVVGAGEVADCVQGQLQLRARAHKHGAHRLGLPIPCVVQLYDASLPIEIQDLHISQIVQLFTLFLMTEKQPVV